MDHASQSPGTEPVTAGPSIDLPSVEQHLNLGVTLTSCMDCVPQLLKPHGMTKREADRFIHHNEFIRPLPVHYVVSLIRSLVCSQAQDALGAIFDRRA